MPLRIDLIFRSEVAVHLAAATGREILVECFVDGRGDETDPTVAEGEFRSRFSLSAVEIIEMLSGAVGNVIRHAEHAGKRFFAAGDDAEPGREPFGRLVLVERCSPTMYVLPYRR
jgi:hypothetical protein